MTRRFSRRDVLKGARRARSRRLRRAGSRRRPPARSDHAGADRGGEEGRQGRLLHGDGPAVRRTPRQGVRGEVSRHRGARRALRRRARVPAHRPGVCAATSTPSTWSTPPTSRIVIVWKRNGWLAPYLPEEVAQAFRQATTTIPDGLQRHDARAGLAARLQHQSGEDGGRAEELRRSARSEMDGQDGQGASGL